MSKKPISLTRRFFWALCTLLAVAVVLSVSYNSSQDAGESHWQLVHLPEASAADIILSETATSQKEAADTESESPIQILLIGQDHREGTPGSRADSIILCTFHQDAEQVIMTSFLRDLYVPIPGHGSNRLNAAYAYGGMALLRQTLETNFDLTIDGCVEVDFSQFSDVLDLLGGVTITLRQDEAEAINKATAGELTEGTHLLNGSQALAYTRIRNLDDDGDFSRTNRQRNVIASLLRSYEGASLFTILSVIPEVLPMLSTDMEERRIIATIVKLLPMLSGSTVVSQWMPADGMYTYSTIQGMSVLTADLDDIRQQLQKSLLSPAP